MHSQFEALERPESEEGDVLVVGVAGRGVEDVEREVENKVREVMMENDGVI